MNRKIQFILVFCFVASTLHGQSTNVSNLFQSNLKKADLLYDHLAYRNALELYRAVIRKDSNNLAAKQRMAECYFRLGNMKEAEHWYSSLANTPGIPPQCIYQYAQVLTIQGKYPEAEKWFLNYLTIANDARAKSKLDFIRNVNYYLRDSALFTIRNESYNSDQSDFAPQFYGEGSVFVSARDRDLFIKRPSASALNDDESMLNIYYAPKGAAGEKDAVAFSDHDLNSYFHDGPIVFYADRKKTAFSRNNLVGGKPVTKDGRINLKLYFGDVGAENKMKNVEPFEFNSDTYSIGHPWISEDGQTLYFSSNQPGGQGGVDIYKTEKKNGKWMNPENLGPTINTLGDEFYPFMLNDTTLYFSSTGHGGLGGLDIYVSKKKGNSFSNPQNLGYPMNTSSDDFSIVVDKGGRSGMFSSNRPGGVGYDDIYSFTIKAFFIIGRTVESDSTSQIVPNAKILVMNKSHRVIDSTYSDERGRFNLDLPFDGLFSFSAVKPGYSWIDTVTYSTMERTLGMDSIVLPLWKHDLFAKGFIYSNESQEKLEEVTVRINNLTDGTMDSVITTSAGEYNFLIKPNKKYVISGNKNGFISQEFVLNTKGITKGNLLNDFVLEEESLEKVVIRFDFEKWDIKPAFVQSLMEVSHRMKKNKKYHLHIGAYADSQGTHEFNLDLSNKRAKEVVSFMESQGIDKSRITATGFGEELLLNRCSNGVICGDEEHAKNRRAELKVQSSTTPTK